MSLKAFIAAFFEAALWSSTDNSNEQGGDPLDMNYSVGDIDPRAIEALSEECAMFYAAHELLFEHESGERSADEMAGHNFWFTRNRHGCGFWDGDYPEHGDFLTEASNKYREVDLYVGDDGIVYASGYEKGRVS